MAMRVTRKTFPARAKGGVNSTCEFTTGNVECVQVATPALELRGLTKRYDDGHLDRFLDVEETLVYLEEAEELCEDIALIRGGRVIARDTADGLRASCDADSLADVYVKAMAAP
jgi:predicted transcriptional regulator